MKQGTVDLNSLTMRFGGALSKPHNIFTATLHKAPTYELVTHEYECYGGGWRSQSKFPVKTIIDNKYFVFKDSECIGVVKCTTSGRYFLEELNHIEKKLLNEK